jgi:murein DD-endopeptidase MepM/ murein hydrolase activator NlpD
MGLSWFVLAARAARVGTLEARLQSMEADQARVGALAHRLQELEARYGRLRSLFGPESAPPPSDLWVAPPAARDSRPERPGEESLPTAWPLTVPGFVTRTLLEGGDAEHPGLDIAVPGDSYIRASGAGAVVDAGEDPVYGRYVVVDHGDGYRTRYAHASTLFVEPGQTVRRHEVIALSGSTGRSTAPHLHFELLRDGEPVDPLTLIEPL